MLSSLRRSAVAVAATLACGLFGGAACAKPPHVVATIAPFQSLAAAVMQGVATPGLLIPAALSVHEYALKPSDVQKLSEADLVIWDGPVLEAYIVKPLATAGTRSLALIDIDGMDPQPFPGGDAAVGATPSEELGLDPHIWLDPVRAERIVEAISDVLSELDAENAPRYRANADAEVGRLKALDVSIRNQLASVAGVPFVTFHDAYSYFNRRYSLNQVGQLTVEPDRRPGAATVAELRQKVTDNQITCAFAEPQFDTKLIRSMIGSGGTRVSELDPLGAGLEVGPTLYEKLLERNVAAMKACLSPVG